MTYFRTCPYCRSNLDPGEKCNCEQKKQDKLKENKKDKDGDNYKSYFAAANKTVS